MLLNNGKVIMITSHLLLHNITSQGNDNARMKADGNFSDASVERFYSVS